MIRKTLFILITCLGVALVASCRDSHDDHDHPPAGGADEHNHDHGHDHGDEHDHGGDAHDDHDHAAHDDHGDEAHADEVTLTSEAVKRWGIRTEPLTRHNLVETLNAPARVAFNAERVAHVGSVVSGRVTRIEARIGDEVKVGDLLLVIVSPELGEAQSAYLQRRGAIKTAEATVAVAKSIHDRARALYDESQGIALSEVQRREAEYRAAEGELVAAKSAVAAAENVLSVLGMTREAIDSLGESGQIDPSYAVHAPIAGRVIAREVTLGESVGPDRDSLLVLADLGTLWVIADVPEVRLGAVRIGSKATVSVPAFADRAFEGEVTYLGAQLNPATRTIPVRIEVRDNDGLLRPGMFAQASVRMGDPAGGATPAIPEAAVQRVEGDTCVFVPVEGEANTFAKRVVRIGPPIGGMVPLLAGLEEGERYVAHGSFILKADLGKAGAAHQH